jgi:hypothetical protein
MSTTGVEVDVHKIGANIATVRNVVPIKLLCETLANHACRKGIGKHDKIFSDILTLGQPAANLPVVGVVVLDVL